MLKRALIALLATPLLAAGAVAILLAMRHHEDPDRAAAVPRAQTPEELKSSAAAVVTETDELTLLQRTRRLERMLEVLQTRERPVTVAELQLLTEELASTTALIRDAAPGSLPELDVTTYFAITLSSLDLLSDLDVADDASAALISARGIAEFGRETVAQYLVATQFEVSRPQEEAGQPLTSRDGGLTNLSPETPLRASLRRWRHVARATRRSAGTGDHRL